MAVQYNSFAGSASAYQTTFSLSHTIGDYANRVAILTLQGGAADRVPTGVQYGTQVATKFQEFSYGGSLFRAFYLLAPTVGTANWTRTDSGAGWDILVFNAMAFYNVQQADPPYYDVDYNCVTTGAGGGSVSQTIDTLTGQLVWYTGVHWHNNGTISGTGTDVQEYTWSVATTYGHTVQGYQAVDAATETVTIGGGWGTSHYAVVRLCGLLEAPPHKAGPSFPAGFSPNNDIGRQSKLRARQRWGYS